MVEQVFLAVDLGASGGRVLAGLFDGRLLRLEEIHRFENGARARGGWSVLGHFEPVGPSDHRPAKGSQPVWTADQKCRGRHLGRRFRAAGPGGRAVGKSALLPRSTIGRRAGASRWSRISREEIFSHTGLQFMPINTLYQVLALREQNSPLLEMAETFLMMPDLFHWLLTGVKANEFTNATTTQFFNPTERRWATELFDRFDVPTRMLGTILQPGTRLGKIMPQVAAETGLADVDVILPGTHDTASAVMAVPAAGEPQEKPNWCYISSGTWSLMGAETTHPVVTDHCRRLNFTNEGGVGNTIRLLKNITGLWLVQECRRVWAHAGKDLRWDDLNHLAAAAPPLTSFINPDDASFQSPGEMPAAIQAYCRNTAQTVPGDEGAIIRCAQESLAMKCRQVLGWLEELVGSRMETIHIVGGGTRNFQLLPGDGRGVPAACGGGAD